MSKEADPRLIAKALRFLATGFDLAAGAGVPGIVRKLRKLSGGAEEACGRDWKVNAFCSVEMLHMGSFEAALPHDFLMRAIASGSERCVLEGGAARGSASFGGPPQDGSETYFLERVELNYRELPGARFSLVVDMTLGEPIMHTFVYRGPVREPDMIYRVELEAEFKEIFRFLSQTTKRHAEAIVRAFDERFGLKVEMPGFYINE